MNGYFNYKDELYHHGVLGMKWGVRRYQSYSENPKLSDRQKRKLAYKESKANYKRVKKEAKKELRKSGIFAGRDYAKTRDSAIDRINKAEFEKVTAKGKIKGTEKAERRAYIKAMKKYGLPGSAASESIGGKGTKFYDYVEKTKGSEYAKSVESSAKKELIGALAASTAVMIGSTVASFYLSNQ